MNIHFKLFKRHKFGVTLLIHLMLTIFLMQTVSAQSLHEGPLPTIPIRDMDEPAFVEGQVSNVENSVAARERPSDENFYLYLPIIVQAQAARQWQMIGGSEQALRALTLGPVNDDDVQQIITVDPAGDNSGGIYKLQQCQNGGTPERLDVLQTAPYAYDLAMNGNIGIGVTFSGQVYRSTDQGATWFQSAQSLSAGVYAVTFGQENHVYVAADAGLYQSTDSGQNWNLIAGPEQLRLLNTLLYDQESATLWIGAAESGVWRYNSATFEHLLLNLPDDGASRDIWAIKAIPGTPSRTLIGTSNGVFMRIGNGNWERVGSPDANALAQTRIYSLIQVDGFLIAGTSGNGGWRIPLANITGEWQQMASNDNAFQQLTIREFLFSNGFCDGLVAATDEGLWVFR